jgi:hypothetical protein
MTSKSLSDKSLFGLYLDFDRFRPAESVNSYESSLSEAYYKFINDASKSQERINASDVVKGFTEKAISFIAHVIKIIIQIIYNVINFFKKLIVAAMDISMIRNYSEFYETHRETILTNFRKYGSSIYVSAIPPKSINSFGSDNKISLSVQQTANLLEELERSFKQRAELWDQQAKNKNRDSNTIFDELLTKLKNAKNHILDSAILVSLGIMLNYDMKPLSLYDPQVKDYLTKTVNENFSGDFKITKALGTIFAIPKKVINLYLFGHDEVKPDVIPISGFLQMTGPKEFDKLYLNDMSRIKSNILYINDQVKRMELISKKIEVSGDRFCESLKKNTPMLMNLFGGGDNYNTRSLIEFSQELILPLLPVISSFYSYFSSLIINYSMYYCRHRKALFESAKMLVQKEEAEAS